MGDNTGVSFYHRMPKNYHRTPIDTFRNFGQCKCLNNEVSDQFITTEHNKFTTGHIQKTLNEIPH